MVVTPQVVWKCGYVMIRYIITDVTTSKTEMYCYGSFVLGGASVISLVQTIFQTKLNWS